jgi:hypothetical protein
MDMDMIQRMLAERRSRRGVLAATALTATAGALVTTNALAQDATPEVTETVEGTSTTMAEATPTTDTMTGSTGMSDEANVVFIQQYRGGRLVRKDDQPNSFEIDLDDAVGETLFVAQGGDQRFGALDTEAFFQGLGYTPENPPTGVLVLKRERDVDGDDDVYYEAYFVALYNPDFDDDNLRYDLLVSDSHVRRPMQSQYEDILDFDDDERGFDQAYLFIDGCPNAGNAETCFCWHTRRCQQCGTC